MNTSIPTPAIEISVHEDTAKRKYSHVQILKQKLKEKRAMLKDAFENDAGYDAVLTEVNEKKKELAKVRGTIAQQPAIVALKNEIRDLVADVKDQQISLFEDLEAYTRTTGATTIEIDGTIKKIVKNYKVVNSK